MIMPDISSLTIQNNTYTLKDSTARSSATQAQSTAESAQSTAESAQTTATSALNKVNGLELTASLSGEVLTLSLGDNHE